VKGLIVSVSTAVVTVCSARNCYTDWVVVEHMGQCLSRIHVYPEALSRLS